MRWSGTYSRWWTLCGISCAWAILLRPDGGLLLGGIGLPVAALGWRETGRRREMLTAMVLLVAVSLAPLVPWTIRNWRVFHIVQPLVAMSATNPGEYLAYGWGHWLKSWLIDYANTEDVSFQVPGQPVDPNDIPSGHTPPPRSGRRWGNCWRSTTPIPR